MMNDLKVSVQGNTLYREITGPKCFVIVVVIIIILKNRGAYGPVSSSA